MDNIMFVFICWFCAAIVVILGFSCFRRTSPVSFWSGTDVKKQDVTSVKKYNRANGVMWCIYSLIFWAAGIASLCNSFIAVVLLIFSCTGGILGLIVGYNLIKRRFFVSYRYSYVASKLNDYK